MRISDWSSDVCSSDLRAGRDRARCAQEQGGVDHLHPPMEQPQFPGVMRAILADQGGLEHFERARSIDHAGAPRDAHVEDLADASEAEHRTERTLDRLEIGRSAGGETGFQTV